MSADENYRCRFRLEAEHGDFTTQEVEGDEIGACDAFIFVSMLFNEAGDYSQLVTSFDGRSDGEHVTDRDLFMAWSALAHQLSESKALPPKLQAIAQAVHEVIVEEVSSK